MFGIVVGRNVTVNKKQILFKNVANTLFHGKVTFFVSFLILETCYGVTNVMRLIIVVFSRILVLG